MLLLPDPGLAEVPGFSREQLDALARSVELRRQQLEKDIKDYIKHRRDELRTYEQELLAQHRSMECVEDPESADRTSSSSNNAENDALSASTEPSAQSPPDTKKHEPEEKTKRTKHSRVQKREKELYGLVTPVFLPLLDARDMPPKLEKKQPKQKTEAVPTPANSEHTTPTGDAERAVEGRKARREHTDMEGGTSGEHAKDAAHAESAKKTKRSPMKKSALRQHTTIKPRRKRVSLVIDGQTVLPADTVIEPPLMSPSSEATSTSNSTASLDDMIDPRLTKAEPQIHTEHYDAVHHSLPQHTTTNMHSPTKPLIETPNPKPVESALSPRSTTTSILPFNPPSTAVHTFLDPSPTHASNPASVLVNDSVLEDPAGEAFNTYVGGLRGSGADDVDQAGSYGYPSSLGASYLESYMQSRPLRVRREAADKAGLDEREKREMVARPDKEDEDVDMDVDSGVKAREEDDADGEGDFMGEMEGFD